MTSFKIILWNKSTGLIVLLGTHSPAPSQISPAGHWCGSLPMTKSSSQLYCKVQSEENHTAPIWNTGLLLWGFKWNWNIVTEDQKIIIAISLIVESYKFTFTKHLISGEGGWSRGTCFYFINNISLIYSAIIYISLIFILMASDSLSDPYIHVQKKVKKKMILRHVKKHDLICHGALIKKQKSVVKRMHSLSPSSVDSH